MKIDILLLFLLGHVIIYFSWIRYLKRGTRDFWEKAKARKIVFFLCLLISLFFQVAKDLHLFILTKETASLWSTVIGEWIVKLGFVFSISLFLSYYTFSDTSRISNTYKASRMLDVSATISLVGFTLANLSGYIWAVEILFVPVALLLFSLDI